MRPYWALTISFRAMPLLPRILWHYRGWLCFHFERRQVVP